MTPLVQGTYESWHTLARDLLARRVPPERVHWRDTRDPQPSLLPHAGDDTAEGAPSLEMQRGFAVPRTFITRATVAAHHRDPARWSVLYRLLWRITSGQRDLLADPLDDDVRALERMVTEVQRDEHRIHAFVRFRKLTDAGGEHYVAYHRPDHFTLRLAAPFFVQRFRIMRWSILTPDESAHWDGNELSFSAGVSIAAAPHEDEIEDVWRTYYGAIFNPARVNPRAMQRDLPARHWATLPEARVIPGLIAEAPERLQRMLTQPAAATSARAYVAEGATLDELREAAGACRGCPLFASATKVVFGEGPASARVMLVGEQPGDEEDTIGRPFVGPAGRVLTDAIARAGLVREDLYVTNAVKHFTYRREGKRRIHERPRATDVRACRPWLAAEIEQVKPTVIVCLGSTAAQTLVGSHVRIQRDRGKTMTSAWAEFVVPTYHPSAVLRAAEPRHSGEIFDWLVEDLRYAAELDARSTMRLP